MVQGPFVINKKILILVEGSDEERFLPLLAQARGFPDFQCKSFNGIPELPRFLKNLPNIPGFSNVASLGIIRDADDNPATALQSTRDALRNAALPVPETELSVKLGPPKTAIFLTPGNGSPGALESCLLRSVGDNPDLECIDALLACMEGRNGIELRQKDKVRVQAFLATRVKVFRQISEGARAGIWPFEHTAFDGFERLLSTISNHPEGTA